MPPSRPCEAVLLFVPRLHLLQFCTPAGETGGVRARGEKKVESPRVRFNASRRSAWSEPRGGTFDSQLEIRKERNAGTSGEMNS